MVEKACRKCRSIIVGDVCPLCKESDLTKSWDGYIAVVNPENSEIAKAIGVTVPGKYALKLR